jgi:hypothetical protein
MKHIRATIVAVEEQWVLHNLCVFAASDIQHAMRLRHIIICGVPHSTILSHIIS